MQSALSKRVFNMWADNAHSLSFGHAPPLRPWGWGPSLATRQQVAHTGVITQANGSGRGFTKSHFLLGRLSRGTGQLNRETNTGDKGACQEMGGAEPSGQSEAFVAVWVGFCLSSLKS